MTGWAFSIDRGGTFTDVVARAPDGPLVTAKLLSDNPERYDHAAVAGLRIIPADRGGGGPPHGRLVTAKLLSDNPERYDDAAVAGIRMVLAEQGGGEIASVKMG